jgi:hypothetical protein
LLSRDLFPERLENIVLLDSDAGFARATKGETRVYESPGDMLIANVSQEFCTVCVSIHICNTRAIVVIGPTHDKCFVACSSLPARALSTRLLLQEIATRALPLLLLLLLSHHTSTCGTSRWLILVAQRSVPLVR